MSGPIRQPLWAALRRREEPASVPDLAREIGAPDRDIAWRLSRWVQAGLLETTTPANDAGQHARTHYIMPQQARRLAAPPALDSHGKASSNRGGRGAMWRAMRVLKSFDLVQLCMTAEVSEASAKVFVSALLRAQILRRMSRGNAATGQRSIYALVGTPGPKPPIIRVNREDRTTTVLDPNTGTARKISAQAPLPPLF